MMKLQPTAMALTAAALLAGAPAAAQGNGFRVHNSTGRVFTCVLARRHSSVDDRYTLRPGGDLSRDARDGSSAELRCDTGVNPLRATLRPGTRYELVDDHSAGGVALRIVGAR